MEQLSVFLQTLHRSGLLPAGVIDQEVRRRPSDSGWTPESFSQHLIQRDLLTEWQVEHLLKGKHKGYFHGAYKILKLLGRGGQASVYLAQHTTLDQLRVIKVLSKRKRREKPSSSRDRFVREAQAAARLDHPNVVRCFDVVMDPRLSYIVMEYFPGQDLEKYIRQHHPIPFAECINFAVQAAHGLQYTQASGMIHRDIKPSNLLLTQSGRVKLLDLGLAMLARNQNEDGSLTGSFDENLGTADYISPEQARNSHDIDFRADIYSLGCTLYHLLVGRPPFSEGTIIQRVAKHQTEMPQPILEQRPDCPRALADICWKMIQKSPEDRFSSYDALIRQLNGLLATPVDNPRPLVLAGHEKPASRLRDPDSLSAAGADVSPALKPDQTPALDTDPIDSVGEETLPEMAVFTSAEPDAVSMDAFMQATSVLPPAGTDQLTTPAAVQRSGAHPVMTPGRKPGSTPSRRHGFDVALVVAGVVLGAALMLGGYLILNSSSDNPAPASPALAQPLDQSAANQD